MLISLLSNPVQHRIGKQNLANKEVNTNVIFVFAIKKKGHFVGFSHNMKNYRVENQISCDFFVHNHFIIKVNLLQLLHVFLFSLIYFLQVSFFCGFPVSFLFHHAKQNNDLWIWFLWLIRPKQTHHNYWSLLSCCCCKIVKSFATSGTWLELKWVGETILNFG